MNIGAWRGILVVIIYCFVVSEVSAQESRPLEVTPIVPGALPKISPEESERRLQDAMLLYKSGKTDAAIYMLQQVQKADPTNYKVLFRLGEMAIDAKNWAYAIEVLRKASLLRPNDIEVRLILMDIYKAYQMPIEEIMVGKEILALNPNHVIAATRLAELYHEQEMIEDEVKTRFLLKHLQPDNYTNLKRLAMTLNESDQSWEAARVYEQIWKYFPDKLEDMRRLAAIYDKLGESFREAQVLDRIAEQGGERGWLQSRAETRLRSENNIYDPLKASLLFRQEEQNELDIYTVQPIVEYTHVRVRSSLDLGVIVEHAWLRHKGKGDLTGKMRIHSSSVLLTALQEWLDSDYTLRASLGFIYDNVSGSLRPRDPNAGINASDYPFLEDPSFDSYGGTLPVGGVRFSAQPGLNAEYLIGYEHGLVEDLDARLDLFYFDRVTLGLNYQANDQTELTLQADNTIVSDGNYRLHGLAAGYYTLWVSTPMRNYRGRRRALLHNPPPSFFRIGYEFEYFNDDTKAEDDKYETFVEGEKRHKGVLEGQTRLFTLGPDGQILFNVQLSYSEGTTLEYARGVAARLFYFSPDSKNDFGLTYAFEKQKSTNVTRDNLLIGGREKSHEISLNVNWHF